MSTPTIVIAPAPESEAHTEPIEVTPAPLTEDEIRADEREQTRREVYAEMEQSEQWQKINHHSTALETMEERLNRLETERATIPTPSEESSQETAPPAELESSPGVTQLEVDEADDPAVEVDPPKKRKPSIW